MGRRKYNTWLYDHLGMWRVRWIVCVVTLGFVLAIVAITGIVAGVESVDCSQAGDRQGLNTSFRIPSGCYVELPNGRWIPDDLYPPKHLHIEGRIGR